MEEKDVVQLFNIIDKTTSVIQQEESETYLDSLTRSLEAMFFEITDEPLGDKGQHIVDTSLTDINVDQLDKTTIRKAVQLAILKGMKEATQPQHLMTPETIAMFIGYLAEKLTKDMKDVRLFDPVSGTANLLLIVLEQLKNSTKAYGNEIDPTLLKLALLYANLQQKEVEFFHQDSMRPFLLDPVDLVVADLPVGYYPDDIRANDFELKADEGHSYAHHLIMEQSFMYTKEGGYLIFIIPESLFQSEQADKLHAFMKKHAHIIGLIQLSDTLFKGKEQKKSIFILQKKGPETKGVKQPLLAMLPSFQDGPKMENMLLQINNWFEENM